ncbi:phosphoadenylyl-sulfate reductase [Sulfitobacter donghicola]|uniref:Adenosine 5'-phosphosulfate reductase n=1 Tax=Sulfitobacter donghicola DSW-25 = KCTC 12864 = JCM 14565 TaxID=1300350 RepID=A0A073IL03_9RHOB|nr:phosphoadenylyl-sulfate reductase [Sulfitobacter donghicola]KEJ90265.1 phosphoadenosine phosphosulfate reductase [Sulfitobacter donghicola DSW-25 = KCTC 12864 = JCM 14565]KIN66565.1 Phosophoadenylyl-sulfate reductase [Sulfitobacter donghicola DSW-25 = KCTC 12864 = JCM 14565]
MPRNLPPQARVEMLNAALKHHSAPDILKTAFDVVPNLALVSSFGAESVALLYLASRVNPDVQVIFIDTMLLFPETLQYQKEVAKTLGLRRVQVLRANTALEDPDNTLLQRNTDACCDLRKTRVLDKALSGYDGWITGRKRFQSGERSSLVPFETEEGTGRIKVNPLAHWTREDVLQYIEENNLPRHPLVAKGYPSIGCAPCTSPVAEGEDIRAGRWRGEDKDECGIHFVNGKMVRVGAPT